MKLKNLVSAGCLFVFVFPAVVLGFEAKVKKVGPDSVTVQTGQNRGAKVTSIDLHGDTTEAPAANVDTYKVMISTAITVDGLPSKLSDVKKGMKVVINQGTDSAVAAMISANTVPPKPAPTPKPDKKNKGPKKLSRRIDTDQVIAITSERITFGQIGADKARAYFIAATTDIHVNGVRATADAIKIGMDVHVNARDGTTAGSIIAEDASN